MSVVFAVLLLLLLLLLGFSSHACGGIVVDHHSISKETADEKLNPEARVSIPPLPNDATRDEDGDRTVENESDDHRVKASGKSESEAVASGRWRVPHRKKGGAEPVFNLDYLPPKTHPPVHN